MEMDAGKAAKIVDAFAEYSHCFTTEDLLIFAEEELDQVLMENEQAQESLLQVVEDGSRFLPTFEETSGKKYFIASKTLYRWYINLNVRLAKANSARLSSHQLGSLLSSLRSNGRWASPPTEYIMFGQQAYLISPSLSPNEYVFPLAQVLSFMSPSNIRNAAQHLHDLPYGQKLESTNEQIISKAIEDALARFTERQRYVITRRHGLLGNAKKTLEQIGQDFRVTRERVRQIEEKCWNRIRHPAFSRVLVAPLMSYILLNQGSLIVDSHRAEREMRFIAKCLNIPLSQILHTDLLILGKTDRGLVIPKDIWDGLLDIEAKAEFLQSNFNLVLSRNDLVKIVEVVSPVLLSPLTKSQKVYLALKQIGEPAHYSEVTEVYNALFPECPSNERNIHAVLSREQNGVVWIGIKGTFALEEWGYKHPSQTIFDTVTEIVERKFAETGKCVPFSTIAAEIGKYRQAVRPASITFAAYLNPSLEQVYGDCFIPRTGKQEEKEISTEELDEILEEFERQNMADRITYE